MRKNFNLQKFRFFNDLLSNTYPAVLFKMIIINTSWAVNTAGNLALNFVHPNTRKKVGR